MKARARRSAGFTLVELMVVIAIIAIIAALAIPSYMRFATKAKEVEGEVALRQIRTIEDEFFLEDYSYTDDLAIVGNPTTPLQYYELSVELGDEASDVAYQAIAYPKPERNEALRTWLLTQYWDGRWDQTAFRTEAPSPEDPDPDADPDKDKKK